MHRDLDNKPPTLKSLVEKYSTETAESITRTKVKLLTSSDTNTLEDFINDFIKDKKVIDIKYQSFYVTTQFSNGVPRAGTVFDRAMIIYEEAENDA